MAAVRQGKKAESCPVGDLLLRRLFPPGCCTREGFIRFCQNYACYLYIGGFFFENEVCLHPV